MLGPKGPAWTISTPPAGGAIGISEKLKKTRMAIRMI
jgi:hypothetical protein